jgi:hypothetical protein
MTPLQLYTIVRYVQDNRGLFQMNLSNVFFVDPFDDINRFRFRLDSYNSNGILNSKLFRRLKELGWDTSEFGRLI